MSTSNGDSGFGVWLKFSLVVLVTVVANWVCAIVHDCNSLWWFAGCAVAMFQVWLALSLLPPDPEDIARYPFAWRGTLFDRVIVNGPLASGVCFLLNALLLVGLLVAKNYWVKVTLIPRHGFESHLPPHVKVEFPGDPILCFSILGLLIFLILVGMFSEKAMPPKGEPRRYEAEEARQSDERPDYSQPSTTEQPVWKSDDPSSNGSSPRGPGGESGDFLW